MHKQNWCISTWQVYSFFLFQLHHILTFVILCFYLFTPASISTTFSTNKSDRDYRAVPTFTVTQPHVVSSFPPLKICCQHMPESSTVPGVPLCGLCQSVCAALMLPTCIVLESRVVSGPVAAVLVWIRGWILTPQGLHGTTGPRLRDSQRFPAIRWDRQTVWAQIRNPS